MAALCGRGASFVRALVLAGRGARVPPAFARRTALRPQGQADRALDGRRDRVGIAVHRLRHLGIRDFCCCLARPLLAQASEKRRRIHAAPSSRSAAAASRSSTASCSVSACRPMRLRATSRLLGLLTGGILEPGGSTPGSRVSGGNTNEKSHRKGADALGYCIGREAQGKPWNPTGFHRCRIC